MGTAPSYHRACDSCPVESITWYDAWAFLNELSAAERLPSCYPTTSTIAADCGGYRLPTEAEWEYAARASTSTALIGGELGEKLCGPDPILDAEGWYCGNAATTSSVAKKRPNPWGLYDMIGNVYEWVHDSYGPDYYAASPAVDPAGPEERPACSLGQCRVVRGCSYASYAMFCRNGGRDYLDDDARPRWVGLRPVRTVRLSGY